MTAVAAKRRFWVEDESSVTRCGRGGVEVLDTPLLNKNTAFTRQERAELGLEGLLPSAVQSLEDRVRRVYEQYHEQPTDLLKNVFLASCTTATRCCSTAVGEHVREMLPIVYTPTVGTAIQEFSHLFRRPRGVFLNIEDARRDRRGLDATGLGAGRRRPGRGLRCRGDPGHRRLGRRRHRHLDRQARRLHRGRRHRPAPGAAGGAGRRHQPRGAAQRPALPRHCARPGPRRAVRRVHRRLRRRPSTQLFPNAILHWEDFGAGHGPRHPRAVRATASARSTTTSRAPARSCWPRALRPCGSPAAAARPARSWSSAPARPGSGSPT